MDKLRVGIPQRNADSEVLKLLLKGAIRQNEDGDARRVTECVEKKVVLVDTVKVNVTVDASTNCRVRKRRVVCVCVCGVLNILFIIWPKSFNPCTQN